MPEIRLLMALVGVATLAAGVGLSVIIPGASAADPGPDQYTIPPKRALKYSNLGSRLDEMVARVEGGESLAQEAAEDGAMHREESVAVAIHLSGAVDGVVTFLDDNGGDPRNVAEGYIEAYVPVTLLGQLSERAGYPAGAGNRPAATGPGVPGHCRTRSGGAWLAGLEPVRLERRGYQTGCN